MRDEGGEIYDYRYCATDSVCIVSSTRNGAMLHLCAVSRSYAQELLREWVNGWHMMSAPIERLIGASASVLKPILRRASPRYRAVPRAPNERCAAAKPCLTVTFSHELSIRHSFSPHSGIPATN